MEVVFQMIHRRKILLFLIWMWSQLLFAQAVVINNITVDCDAMIGCEEITNIFQSLKRSYTDENHFYTVMKLYVASEGIKELDFKIELNHLSINVKLKPKIADIVEPTFKGRDRISFPTILPIKIGDYLDEKKVLETVSIYKDFARENGYPSAEIKFHKTLLVSGVRLGFEVDLQEANIVSEINVTSSSNYIKRWVNKKFNKFLNGPFKIQQIKLEVEDVRKLLISYGYYLINLDLKYTIDKKQNVKLYFEVKNVRRYTFYLPDQKQKDITTLKAFLVDNYVATRRELSNQSVENLIREYFEKLGYKFSLVQVTSKVSQDINSDEVLTYTAFTSSGKLSELSSLQFKGNSFLSDDELTWFYYETASELAKLNKFDYAYYDLFKQRLREIYISKGFLSVVIDAPSVQFENKTQNVRVTYKIREGLRTVISNINILGMEQVDTKAIEDLILNKTHMPFDPIQLKNDLRSIEDYLKKNGYYFGKITNLNDKSLVQYFADNSQVRLKIEIDSGPKVYADQVIIIGNKTTRKLLIKRELAFKSNELLTKEAIDKSQANLLRLGLFSTVKIKPVSSLQNKTDVLIFLKEKDFGNIEFAPGVRSDLGFKLSTAVTYNNLDGMNKRIKLQGTVNRRFDLNSLDNTRRTKGEKLLEYDTSISFLENHIFHSDYNLSLTTTKAKKRFVSYDADIQRVGYTVSKDFTNWLTGSVKQQVEVVSQYNATDDLNHGHFQIGAFTPSILMDFRDRKVNPHSGAELGISVEFANPFFLSQSNEELTIDYYKAISRTKFYVPMGETAVLALSGSFGIQENLAKTGEGQGYIPGIKVFRLSGADIVRGYEDEEINTLISGTDISKVEVSGKAYMANIKIEPRYYLSDSTVLGVFYDAGRVFVNNFDSQSLRSSVGISFKYITPVGTLDFDYGIKTLRKTNSSGKFESPAKLHISIGFF